MGWLTDEALFYGGMIAAACAAAAAVITMSIFQIRKVRLDIRLDAEYGPKAKKKKQKKHGTRIIEEG